MRRNATLRPSSSLFAAAASLVVSSPQRAHPHPTPSSPPPVDMPPPLPSAPQKHRRLYPRRPHRRLKDAISLLHGLACAMGVPPDPRSHWFIVCICRRHVDLGLGALGDAIKRGSPPGAVVLNSLIDGFCAARKYDDARKLFDELPELGCSPNASTGGAIIKGMCRNSDIGQALRLLRDWKKRRFQLEISAYNAVLDRLRRCGAAYEALEVFSGMVFSGVSPDSVTYTALVKCCCSAGRLDLALELLGDFVKRGCRATRGMLNSILCRLVLVGRLAEARALFDWMPEMGCVANVFTCNALLKGLCQAGDVATALKLYREMNAPGSLYQPNMFTYNTLADCLFKEGYLSEAVDVLDEMIAHGFSPNVVTLNILMDFLCKRHWMQEAHDLFYLITRRSTPTEISYNILMHGYCLIGQMDTAKRVFDSMCNNGISPDIFSYNILCNGYCKNRKMEYAEMVLKDMVIRGISPNLVTSTILIDAYCKRGKLREAHEYIANMTQHGFDPSIKAYSSVIDVHCSRGQMDKVFRIMWKMKCQPDAIFYSTILKGYCNIKEITEALKLFDEMWHGGFKPNVITCTTLLNGFFKVKEPFSALQLYYKLESWGLKSTEVTYKVMVDGLEDALQTTSDVIGRKELENRASEFSYQLHDCHWKMQSDMKIIRAWMKSLIE